MKWQNNGVAEDEVRERSWGCVRGRLRMTSPECGVHCGSWGTIVVCSIGEDRQEGAGIGRQLLSGPCNQEGVFIRAVAGLCGKGIKTSRSSANHSCRNRDEPAVLL